MIIGPTSHKSQVFGGLGLGWHNIPFSICHLPTAPVYPHSPVLSTPVALTKTPVPMGPQTCWKSCATLPSRSWTLKIALKFRPLRGRSCGVPAGPIWKKQASDGASSCKVGCDVWPVRWDAVLSSFPMLRAIVTAVSWTTFGNIERPKMWNT